jgi:hypothetical protein
MKGETHEENDACFVAGGDGRGGAAPGEVGVDMFNLGFR